MLSRVTLLLAGSLLWFAPLAATAQTEVEASRQTEVLPNLNVEMVQLVLDEAGMDTEMLYSEDLGEYVLVKHDGKKAVLINKACTDPGCYGLLAVAFVDGDPDAEEINEFNANVNSATLVRLDDGSLMIRRYLIGDYGVTRGSLEVDVRVLLDLIDTWNDWWSD